MITCYNCDLEMTPDHICHEAVAAYIKLHTDEEEAAVATMKLQLPPDIISQIFSLLSFNNLKNAMLVCR